MLLNESVRVRRAGRTDGPGLLLAGVDDPNVFATHDLGAALRGRRPGEPVVLLAHAPSVHREAAAAGVSLVLCGHVHGGQVCLPSGRPLARRRWRFPRRVWRGRWTEGSTQGYTTVGVGACGVPLRLNCPPEIVRIRLVRPAAPAAKGGLRFGGRCGSMPTVSRDPAAQRTAGHAPAAAEGPAAPQPI